MKFNRHFVGLALVVGSIAAGIACSSSSGGGTPTSPTTGSVTQHISAAAGGTVSDAAGTATLSIPAGALAADLDITLATTAAETGTVSSVYNFGPEGTKFATPATLVLAMPSGTTVPSGKTASLATYDGTKWAAIAGSTFASGKVSGPVAHFSKFTIIFVDGQVIAQNSCSDVVTNFHPCGGSVLGTWSFTDWCAANSVVGQDPTDGGCPGYGLTEDVTPSGTITFNGDGSYSNTAITLSASIVETIPTSCLDVAGAKTCDATSLHFNEDGGTCATTGANCVCSATGSGDPQAAKTGTYTTGVNTLTTDNGSPTDYCITGTTLVAADKNPDGGAPTFAYVLTKQ